MPTISIITPTYKWEKYLLQTIRSVQLQNFIDYEHIIIDNSPKNTKSLVKKQQDKDRRIIYVPNKYNVGIADSRNQGLKIAKWKYIYFLDHDDIFISPDNLLKLHDFLELNAKYGIVAWLTISIDEMGNKIQDGVGRESDEDIREHLLQSNQFLPCAMLIRKSALLECWWFDKKYDRTDDYDLRMRIGRKWKIHCLQEYLNGYRVHSKNTSGTIKAQYQMKYLSFKIFWKNKTYYPNFWRALILRSIEFIIPPMITSRIINRLKGIR